MMAPWDGTAAPRSALPCQCRCEWLYESRAELGIEEFLLVGVGSLRRGVQVFPGSEGNHVHVCRIRTRILVCMVLNTGVLRDFEIFLRR